MRYRARSYVTPSAATILLSAALLMTVLIPNRASAQFNVALGKPVIDGSGSWDGGTVGVGAPFNGGQFPARLATDGNKSEPDGGTPSWWLGREQTVEEYFTLDLKGVFNIERIDLYNTHNRQFNDRGTDEFVIFASTQVDANNQLVNPVQILGGNLPDVSFEVDIPAASFTAANGLTVTQARYLKFQALSSIYFNDNVGLNEIEVFDPSFVSPNKAMGKPVIDGSGSWDGGTVGVGAPFDSGPFPATAVTDGILTDTDTSIWLGREGVAEEYFTLDLEGSVNIQEILLRNTTNREFADRGTMDFRILASQSIDGNKQLVNPVEILSGKLPNSAGISPPLDTVFTAANGLVPTTARYLRFETTSATYFNDNVGLNEIEVYDQVQHDPTPRPRDNIALGKPVIDGSGSWDGGTVGVGAPFDGGSFPADRVTDGSLADEHVDNSSRTSYWLGREQTDEEFFTLDLGDVYTIEEIDLRNTHNDQFNDRGTDEFVILGALDVDAQNRLVDPFTIVSGNLTDVSSQVPIEADVFTAANGLTVSDARYLQFVALTFFGVSSGLNEIEVFGRLAGGAPGDYNGNGMLDAEDIDTLSVAVRTGSKESKFDLDRNGTVEDADRTVWVEQLANTYFGDSDLNGEFSTGDLVLVFQAGQYEDNVPGNSGWRTGDWNGDADFTTSDLVRAFQAGGFEKGPRAAAQAVPEPSAIAVTILLALGSLAVVRQPGPRRQ